MRPAITGLAVLLSPLLLAACGGSSVHYATRDLNNRMKAQLTPQIATGLASVTPLPDGSQITLSDQALFAPGTAELTEQGRYVLASFIEGLIEPRLLRIDLASSPATSADMRYARAEAVGRFLSDYRLPSSLQPVQVAQQAQSITLTVVPRQG